MRLIATGKALPSLSQTAAEIDQTHGFATGYCLKHSGVERRYFAASHETQSELGAKALHQALQQSGIASDSLDLLIGACAVPEQALPSTASFIAHAAQLPEGLPVFDVNSSCLSFVTALHLANNLLLTGAYKRIAIVSVDFPSRGLNWSSPEASLIFGDGAAAAIVERSNGQSRVLTHKMQTFTEGRHLCEIRAGGTQRNFRNGVTEHDFLFDMNGKAVFRLASQKMPAFMDSLMACVDGGLASIDCIVPHQASHLGLKHMEQRLGVASDKIIHIYAQHGNQVAASLPTALHEAVEQGKAKAGDRVLLIGTGAGLSLAGLVWDL